jgi:hypothetical protein
MMRSVPRRSQAQAIKAPVEEIRPNDGAEVVDDRCEDTDEVVGTGSLHVEQMDDNCFWAELALPDGRAIVMWFRSRSKIKLIAEWVK